MYSRTAIIESHRGSRSLRTFTSESTITKDMIFSTLDKEGIREEVGHIFILDTPQPEVIEVEIVVHVAESANRRLFIMCTKNGDKGTYRTVPQRMDKESFWELVKTIQKSGVVYTGPDDRHWLTSDGEVTKVIEYSGNGTTICFAKMTSSLRAQLGF